MVFMEEEYEVIDEDLVDLLGDIIDLLEVFIEEFGFNLLFYLCVDGVDFFEFVFFESGIVLMWDEDVCLFVGFVGLWD